MAFRLSWLMRNFIELIYIYIESNRSCFFLRKQQRQAQKAKDIFHNRASNSIGEEIQQSDVPRDAWTIRAGWNVKADRHSNQNMVPKQTHETKTKRQDVQDACQSFYDEPPWLWITICIPVTIPSELPKHGNTSVPVLTCSYATIGIWQKRSVFLKTQDSYRWCAFILDIRDWWISEETAAIFASSILVISSCFLLKDFRISSAQISCAS